MFYHANLKIHPENVSVMKILDCYIRKGKGGLFNYKFVETDLKLLTQVEEGSKIISITFDIPVQDVQSGYIAKNKNILVEYTNYGKSLKYLGPEGDWETMLHLGVKPEIFAPANAKFKGFSENPNFSNSYEYKNENINNENNVSIYRDNSEIAHVEVKNGKVSASYSDDIGKKLAKDWIKTRNFTLPKSFKFEDF